MLSIYTVLVVLALFGVTIFIHELGHFLLARWCGLKIEVFSIGFGPALWKRTVRGITYKIGCLPLGGYVALPQLDPTNGLEAADQKSDTAGSAAPAEPLPPVAPWKKILVSLAGAGGNVLLAWLIGWIIFFAGKPSAPHERNSVLGFVETNSAAYAAGLRTGDELLRVDGRAVRNWEDAALALALSDANPVALDIHARADGATNRVALAVERAGFGLRLIPGVSWMDLCRVASVRPESSAAHMDLRPGDLVVAAAGAPLFSQAHLREIANAHRERDLSLRVRRGATEFDLVVRPAYDAAAGRALIGIVFNPLDFDYDTVVHPRPLAQLRAHAVPILRFLKALVTPKESRAASQAVGGPVHIFYMYWLVVQSSFVLALWFTAMLNINLAIINLLPIPVLDGGHVVFSLLEWIARRPLPARLIHGIYRVFVTLLIALFALLFFRDAQRLILPRFFRSAPHAAESPAPAPEPPAGETAPETP